MLRAKNIKVEYIIALRLILDFKTGINSKLVIFTKKNCLYLHFVDFIFTKILIIKRLKSVTVLAFHTTYKEFDFLNSHESNSAKS